MRECFTLKGYDAVTQLFFLSNKWQWDGQWKGVSHMDGRSVVAVWKGLRIC